MTTILDFDDKNNKQQLNSSRRFITLIDELYDNKCALLCIAQSYPDLLFPSSSASSSLLENGGDSASIAEMNYAFQRTKSRLYQMCSKLWWDKYVHDG